MFKIIKNVLQVLKTKTEIKSKNLREKQKKNLDIIIKIKKSNKLFLKDIKYRNLSKTPVLVTILSLILILNCLIYFLGFAQEQIGLKGLDPSLYPLFFGANHASSIIKGGQFWRLITFAFVENTSGFFQFFISIFFIWFSFAKIGFLQEVFFNWKKSLVIWFVGIIFISLAQFLLTKTEAIYYYGTEYLSWLSVGAMTFLLINSLEKSEQARMIIRSTLIKVVILLIIFGILKFVSIYNNVGHKNSLLRVTGFFICFPILTFFIGFSLALLLNYKNVNSNLAVYSVIIFLIILICVYIIIGTTGLMKTEIGSASWEKIKNYY